MQAIVLAGGYGTRLWPITRRRPKMLLPVGDEVVLDTGLRALESDSRIEDVFISTNERFSDDLQSFLMESDFEKPTLSVESTSQEDDKLGATQALNQLIDREGIAQDILIVGGDHLIDFNLSRFIDTFESDTVPYITARDVGSKKQAKSYGVIVVDDSTVVSLVEKPERPDTTLISPLCYAIPKGHLDSFEAYLAAGHDPDAPGNFIKWFVSETEVRAYRVDEMIMDIGTLDNYLEAIAWSLDGAGVIDDSAELADSNILSNSIIQSGAEIVDSEIRQSVIFEGSRIESATVVQSVIDHNSTVKDIQLRNSLLGPWSNVESGQ